MTKNMTPLPLRVQRRLQTATDIQIATLTLILDRGLANVTNDMIAAQVGISLRTFFNYYPNKEAAALGTPPTFSDESLEAFANGTGSLLEDLEMLTKAHISEQAISRDVLKLIGAVWEKEPSLLPPMHIVGRDMMQRIGAAMALKLSPEKQHLAEVISEVYFLALSQTIRRWSVGADLTKEQIPAVVRATLTQIAGALR